MRCRELHLLHHDRQARERRVAAAVAEVQMAVGDHRQILDSEPGRVQRVGQRYASWAVVVVDIRVRAHPTVEQHRALRMLHHVTQNRLDPRGGAARLLSRPHEVAKVEA